MERNKKLVELYQTTSKHSNYQILPNRLDDLIGPIDITVKSRYEKERMDFFKKNISFEGKKVLDIGGNTGYFSFEAVEAGAIDVTYVEGNKEHALFVQEAANILNFPIKVKSQYYNFESNIIQKETYDIVFLLNVLHHFGDDYGDREATLYSTKEKIKESISYFHNITDHLILQIGFNWKGNRNHPLFPDGTKKEMIGFIKKVSKKLWKIYEIGVAETFGKQILYQPLSKENIKRQDELGEFLNRPIFLMKAIK